MTFRTRKVVLRGCLASRGCPRRIWPTSAPTPSTASTITTAPSNCCEKASGQNRTRSTFCYLFIYYILILINFLWWFTYLLYIYFLYVVTILWFLFFDTPKQSGWTKCNKKLQTKIIPYVFSWQIFWSIAQKDMTWRYLKNYVYVFEPGANPTTFKFLNYGGRLERFQSRTKYFCFQNALGYSRS
jgi:hypothetical protein